MIWSFVYLGIRRVMELLLLLFRSRDAKEVEILVLRHELEVLRRRDRASSPRTARFSPR